LGRVLRSHLSSRGHEITALSRNADAGHLALTELPAVIEDGRADCILHLAWSTVPSTAENNPGVEWVVDLPILVDVLRMLARRADSGRPAPRLVFLSTCAVYGELPENGLPFEESCAPRPLGWYASGKTAAEEAIRRFTTERGVSSLILRVTNPYGFTQAEQCMQGVLPVMVRAAKSGEPFRVWGDGRALKDYLHVDDFSSAVEGVISGGQTGILNVASGCSRPLSDLIKAVEVATGKKLKLVHEKAGDWDVKNGRYSNAALSEATGWKPQVDFGIGLRKLVDEILVSGR